MSRIVFLAQFLKNNLNEEKITDLTRITQTNIKIIIANFSTFKLITERVVNLNRDSNRLTRPSD